MKTEMRKVEAALVVVKDSEKLLIGIRFSVASRSLERDLGFLGVLNYLKVTKRTLQVRLMKLAIRALWLRILKKIRCNF